MNIVENIVKENPCYKAGKKIAVKGLMLHSVGCSQPSAQVFAKRWNMSEAKVCVHAIIDGNTGDIYQLLPWEQRAWHCGGAGNNTHIGVEMCEPSCIKYTGGASFVCSDSERAKETVERTVEVAAELFAFLCKKFDLNPLQDGVIISHKEGHDRGIASGHVDPEHLFQGLGMNFTMDEFRKKVKMLMEKNIVMRTNNIIETEKESIKVSKKEVNDLYISDKCVDLVAKYEGCRLEAYKCPAGVWTIGYGHTAGVKPGDKLASIEAAKELLKQDLKKYSGYVNDYIKNGKIGFSVTQEQFDALTSFCYNCGKGNLEKLVCGRSADVVADKLLVYNKGGGKVLPGLVRRRQEERALFLS